MNTAANDLTKRSCPVDTRAARGARTRSRTLRRAGALALVMLGLAACGDTGPAPALDAGAFDAGVEAGPNDAGLDAGDADVDADVGDAGAGDADVSDAEVGDAAVDADVVDAGAVDAAVSDAGAADAGAPDAGADAFVCTLPPTAADWASQGTPCTSNADCPPALRCQFQSPFDPEPACQVFCVPGVCDACGSGYECFPTTGPDGDVNSCLAL